jgi:hypothetical protein
MISSTDTAGKKPKESGEHFQFATTAQIGTMQNSEVRSSGFSLQGVRSGAALVRFSAPLPK